MCLLWKITYGEFSEFVREKKLHIMYVLGTKYVMMLHVFKMCLQGV